MKKYTIEEFADQIRSKYPSAYDDLTDNQLVSLWLEKFPKDKQLIYIDEDDEDDDDGYDGYEDNISNDSNTGTWALIIISIIVLFFTNPSIEKHKEEVGNECAEIILNEVNPNGESNIFLDYGINIMVELIESSINRNNFYLFSLSEVKLPAESRSRTIGIGILGYVYVFPDAKKEIKTQFKKLKSSVGGS